MQVEFWLPLQISLMADYFNISDLMGNGRRDELRFLCEKRLAAKYHNACVELGSHDSLQPWDERFVALNFADQRSLDILDDYYQAWNHSNRTRAHMIVMPDLYEGKPVLNEHICNWYLYSIEEFLGNDLQGHIAIPQGADEDSPTGLQVREYMVYSDEGMIGMYPGTNLFPDSPRLQRIE